MSKQMGHKDPSVKLKIYAHLIEERKPEAAAKTDAFLVPQPAAQRMGDQRLESGENLLVSEIACRSEENQRIGMRSVCHRLCFLF